MPSLRCRHHKTGHDQAFEGRLNVDACALDRLRLRACYQMTGTRWQPRSAQLCPTESTREAHVELLAGAMGLQECTAEIKAAVLVCTLLQSRCVVLWRSCDGGQQLLTNPPPARVGARGSKYEVRGALPARRPALQIVLWSGTIFRQRKVQLPQPAYAVHGSSAL